MKIPKNELIIHKTGGIIDTPNIDAHNNRNPDLMHLQVMLMKNRMPRNINLKLVKSGPTNFPGKRTYLVKLTKTKEVIIEAADPHELAKKVRRDHKHWELSQFRAVIAGDE